jgi:hypothetical protein
MKLYKPIELETYITRSTLGPGRITGDFGFTRSPGDWTFTEAEKTAFVANPTAARWTGPRTSAVPIPPATTFEYGTSKDAIDKTKLILLQSAALWALVKNDSTVKNLVKTELLWFAAQPKLQMSNSTLWSLSSGHSDGFYMFEISISAAMMLIAYDYIEEAFTATEQATMQAWFKGIADFMRDVFTNSLNNHFVSRSVPIEQYVYKGSTSTVIRATSGGSEGATVIPPWDVWSLHLHYNNRKGHMAVISAMYGAKYGSQSHMDEAKKFGRETIAFMVRPDGIFAELERSDDDSIPSKGLGYALTTIACLLQIADACARVGDYTMYNFKTKFGLGGSGGNVDKGIEWMVLEWGKYLNGTKKVYSRGGVVGNEAYRIDGVQSNWVLCGQVCNFAIAGLYYKNPAITAIYKMDTTKGYYSIPTANIASSGVLQYHQSLVGAGHGLFKYGGMEALDVYAPVVVIPTPPASLNITGVTTSGFTVNWSIVQIATSYKLDVSTSSDFSSFVGSYGNLTVSGVSHVITGLLDNTLYYVRLRAVNSAGTSSDSSTIQTKTTDIPDVEPEPINPNLILRKEIEGNYTVITDADGDIGENADVNRSGGKDIKIWDIGDKISIAWNVSLNQYIIKFKARCGHASNKLAHRNGYRATVNGLVVPCTLDEFSIGPLESGYGGSYWGVYVLDKVISSPSGLNTLTIEALDSFMGVDYVEFYKLEDNLVTKYTMDQLIGIAQVQGTTPINTPEDLFNQIKTQTVTVTLDAAIIALQSQLKATVEGTINSLKVTTPPPTNTFTLTEASRVSADVYNASGVKVRELFAAVNYAVGTHTVTWDGLNDSGVLMPPGNYAVNIVSNNVAYDWLNVIGNTSTALTGANKHRSFQFVHSMACTGTYNYIDTGYEEGWSSQMKFLRTDIQKKYRIRETFQTSMAARFVATDGVYVYHAGHDCIMASRSFVYGTRVSDDTEVLFSSGVSRTTEWGRTFPAAIDSIDSSDSKITGVAVSSYLFISRNLYGGGGTIRTLNKTTGAFILSTSVPSARGVTVYGNTLWVITGTKTIAKYTIESNGALTATGLTITAVDNPLALAITPDGTTISVADKTTNQVFHFSTSTGLTSKAVLGTGVSYTTSPDVNNYKFYFTVADGQQPFLAYEPNGDLWVGDSGNTRMLKYNSSGTYLDFIMYLPHNYNAAVDLKNPTRVFCGFQEFAVDYSKLTTNASSAWTYVKNWAATAPAAYTNGFTVNIFRSVMTFPSGRTYAFLKHLTTNVPAMFELKSNGLVATGLQLNAHANFHIDPMDYSIRLYEKAGASPMTITFKRRAFTSETTAGPQYANATTLVSMLENNTDPIDHDLATMGRRTLSGILVAFHKTVNKVANCFHLGGILPGMTSFKWRGAKTKGYPWITTTFPKDGSFDDDGRLLASDPPDKGVNPSKAGGDVHVVENNIFWNYMGEFWHQSQTNYWHHVTDKGQFLGQFGDWKTQNFQNEAVAKVAGNVWTGGAVKVGDNIFIFHNDESIHAGIHVWKVSNLSSIKEQSFTLTR